jgi:hypothetical protein
MVHRGDAENAEENAESATPKFLQVLLRAFLFDSAAPR